MRSVMWSHWPEYLMEAAGLGLFMISAGLFGTLLEHPLSPVHLALPDSLLRRVIMGAAMGLTAIAIIYSPWGMRSAPHINPATTLTFYHLGKIARADAVCYVAAQFVGGLLGVLLVGAILGDWFLAPPISAVATTPGPGGVLVALVAELGITFLLMLTVLIVSNIPRLAPWTGVFVGFLVASYIVIEAPLSGMSMNPARTFASAVPSGEWMSIWLYFLAPPLAMLAAAQLYVRSVGIARVRCAKLHHDNSYRCIFCEFRARQSQGDFSQAASNLGTEAASKLTDSSKLGSPN